MVNILLFLCSRNCMSLLCRLLSAKFPYHGLFSGSHQGTPRTWPPIAHTNFFLVSFVWVCVLALWNWWQMNNVNLDLMWSGLKFSGQRKIASFYVWAPR